MKTGLNIKTFEAKALIGRHIGYTQELISEDDVKEAIKKASMEIGGFTFSLNLTNTEILVTGGEKDYEEPAVLVESSIYPRFPVEIKEFKEKFIDLIGKAATILKQERISVRFTDESLMIETEYCKNPDLK